MKKPLSYWEKRKAREAFEMYEEVERAALKMNKLYAGVSSEIQEDARRLFRKFQLRHGLSEREAERLLNTILDFTQIEEITAKLKQNPKNQELAAQLESQAYAARINRLQKIQEKTDQLTTGILSQAGPAFETTLTGVAKGAYYREIFGLQQRSGAGFLFNVLTQEAISDILARNWSGKSYSDRLWGNTEALSQSVQRELVKGLLMGKSPFRMSQAIEDEFHKGATAARRLMRTEATYVANQVTEKAYNEAGVEKYIYVAILDLRTSEICRSLDKKRFLVKNAEPGENYPPMHPWCRSTTIAWMPDELLKALQQSAIDPATGERIQVPGNMDYETWYNTYVAGREEEIEQQELRTGRDYTSEQYERYRVYGVGPETYSEFISAKADPETWEVLKLEYKDAKLLERIRTQYNLTVHEGRQGKHILEHNSYKGASYLLPEINPQDLVNQYAGTGEIRRVKGRWIGKQFFKHTSPIGYDVDPITKEKTLTSYFSIEYSKEKGTHIVPRKERE